MKYCRGFGVQSPWAYSFIRYVVNEHYPYYAYERLDGKYSADSPKRKKVARLFFRMANHVQSLKAIDFNAPSNNIYAEYITNGCKKTTIVSVGDNFTDNDVAHVIEELTDVRLIRISMEGRYREFYDAIRRHIEPKTFVVFEGINRTRDCKRFWNAFVNNTPSIVTFDLYYCGIVYKDHSRYKQNYIVNF